MNNLVELSMGKNMGHSILPMGLFLNQEPGMNTEPAISKASPLRESQFRRRTIP